MRVIFIIVILISAEENGIVINTWMIPRAKRKLTSVVYTLAAFSYLTAGEPWIGDTQKQLQFEEMLERLKIKAEGKRRDQRAGGARTYETWLNLLGLTFFEKETRLTWLTLAGEAIVDGSAPVPIITDLLLKLQYPSPYSLRSNVKIHPRFKLRPFRFLLRLLADPRICRLGEEEIAKFVITEAEDESDHCFNDVLQRILLYRRIGDQALPNDLVERYPSSKKPYVTSPEQTLRRLRDNANTFINYLEYTQLIVRMGSEISIDPERMEDVNGILNDGSKPIPINPADEERFQRHYGLPKGKNKDTRALMSGRNITNQAFEESMVRTQFLYLAGSRPITVITPELAAEIAEKTGLTQQSVDRVLGKLNVDTLGVFEASYADMAFSGRDEATNFEKATAEIFNQLGYTATHVGPLPLHPDVLVESRDGYSGILDTKAYHAYSVTNDHRNRMIYNYIPKFNSQGNLAFFQYIGGGFMKNIDDQIQNIADDAKVPGSAIAAKDLVALLKRYRQTSIDHQRLKQLFQINRRITSRDIGVL